MIVGVFDGLKIDLGCKVEKSREKNPWEIPPFLYGKNTVSNTGNFPYKKEMAFVVLGDFLEIESVNLSLSFLVL